LGISGKPACEKKEKGLVKGVNELIREKRKSPLQVSQKEGHLSAGRKNILVRESPRSVLSRKKNAAMVKAERSVHRSNKKRIEQERWFGRNITTL